VLIMYFWSALIAFGALAYSVNSASMWIVLGIASLSAVGLLLLLLPRFTPRTPRWAEAFVPPRYRRRRVAAMEADASTPAVLAVAAAEGGEPEGADETSENLAPIAAGVAGVNGATAIGPRSRFLDRRKAGTSR
jgi:UDP-GlcNAc:undecaprenyl-phosphate GlcNAc-1-phosphate transferase